MLFRLVALLVLIFPLWSASAQDDTECVSDDIQTAISDASTQLASIDTTDIEAALTALDKIQAQLGEQVATCQSLRFEGGELRSEVIGPVTVPSGLYRLILTSSVGTTVETELLDGTCDFDGYFYLTSEGGEAQTIFKSDECTVLFQLTEADSPWTLTFEKIR